MRFSLLLFLLSFNIYSQEIDSKLSHYIRQFNLKTIKSYKNTRPAVYRFGKLLFSDKRLSLSYETSCKTCHDPSFGSGDSLPFAIGVKGRGDLPHRFQAGGFITPRNSPHLYNKGHDSFSKMFWDGRVSHDKVENIFTTPEANLNGKKPNYSYISEKIENVMAMQALFPVLSNNEMRGHKHNDLTNEEVWAIIASRIADAPIYKEFVKDYSNFNIADIGNALAYFQRIEFQVTDTGYDRYLKGDNNALSQKEKRGALVFMESGRCTRCHRGALLTNFAYQNIAVPQLGPGKTADRNDEGRFLVTGDDANKYGFLTQPLRNTALTAPYMHSGAFTNLKEVIEHYDNALKSLDNFVLTAWSRVYSEYYDGSIYLDKNPYRNFYRKQTVAPPVRRALNLSKVQKQDLLCFLTVSLTDVNKLDLVNRSVCN